MRITGGTLRGRTFKVPKTDVRPTKEQVREAIFSSLGDRIVGARVLDLFAGTGALGLEAWSRGADRVCSVEQDRRVFSVLEENVRALCDPEGPAYSCASADVYRYLKNRAPGDGPFDIVLADPPYDSGDNNALLEKTLRALIEPRILSPDGILVFELGASESPVDSDGWRLCRDKTYGDTRVLTYARDAAKRENEA